MKNIDNNIRKNPIPYIDNIIIDSNLNLFLLLIFRLILFLIIQSPLPWFYWFLWYINIFIIILSYISN